MRGVNAFLLVILGLVLVWALGTTAIGANQTNKLTQATARIHDFEIVTKDLKSVLENRTERLAQFEAGVRCLRLPFFAPSEWGFILLGETAICGAGLQAAAGVYGPSLEAYLDGGGNVIRLVPIGEAPQQPYKILPKMPPKQSSAPPMKGQGG